MNKVAAWLESRYPEVTPRQFYRGIFPAGSLEKKGEYVTGRYNAIIRAITGKRRDNGKKEAKPYIMTDDLDVVDLVVESNDFCICAPVSYCGKKREAKNARFFYAIAVDVDHLKMKPSSKNGQPVGLEDLRHQIETRKYLPRPTYIASSGNGLHLYYVLKKPVPNYPDNAFELQMLKRELTRKIWNGYIVDINSERDIQQGGIYQGFRMVGTVTKNGDRVRAFLTGEYVDLDYLNGFVKDMYQAKKTAARFQHVSLTQAAEQWPDWFERRVVNGEGKKPLPYSRAMYEYWLRNIRNKATVGHRYYCIMTLAIIAKKCSYYNEKRNPNPVTYEELEKDCFDLIDSMDALTTQDDNHFGADDVQDALEAFDERFITCTGKTIEYLSGVQFERKIKKRPKGEQMKQKDHLEETRAVRDLRAKRRGEKWDAHNGKQNREETVREWRAAHPDGKKIACIRETGLAKSTVYKHWDACEPEMNPVQPVGLMKEPEPAQLQPADRKRTQREDLEAWLENAEERLKVATQAAAAAKPGAEKKKAEKERDELARRVDVMKLYLTQKYGSGER